MSRLVICSGLLLASSVAVAKCPFASYAVSGIVAASDVSLSGIRLNVFVGSKPFSSYYSSEARASDYGTPDASGDFSVEVHVPLSARHGVFAKDVCARPERSGVLVLSCLALE
jgi:hypothetical protein